MTMKSSEEETGSSGSVSSHSERSSDDQEASEGFLDQTHLPGILPNLVGYEVQDIVKSLTEQLSVALSNISARDALVRHHAKVAEEAVAGWEKAENEIAALKQQLEAAAQKNLALEDQANHLDGALKECVRQLRQVKGEQEQNINEAVVRKTREWESTKFDLESQLSEFKTKLKIEQANHGLQLKLEASEKENSSLKVELVAQSKELDIRTLERDLSTQAAEMASKQHLESIKKVSKLEAECRRLRSVAHKLSSPANDHGNASISSPLVESITDSQSDGGERLHAIEIDIRKMVGGDSSECEGSCTDSWASALIAELDHFKSGKAIGKKLTAASVDIELMDDFLEMERLAAMPDSSMAGSGSEYGALVDRSDREECPSLNELGAMNQRITELEAKLQNSESEKMELDVVLKERKDQLETCRSQLMEAEEKLLETNKQLALANESKQTAETESKAANAKIKEMESLLEASNAEIQVLCAKVISLEFAIEEERVFSAEVSAKCRQLEQELSRRKQEAVLHRAASFSDELKLKQEKELAEAAEKLAECQKTIASLGYQLKSLVTLEEFLIDSKKLELDEGLPAITDVADSRSRASLQMKTP